MASSTATTPLIFHGTLIHSISSQETDIIHNGLLVVSDEGKIVFLQRDVPAAGVRDVLSDAPGLNVPNLSSLPIRFLQRGEFLIPGFVDTHNHAPQWTQRGTGRGLPIMEWLNTVTFPHEAKFADGHYAQKTYASLVDGMIRQGVTLAAYYGSLHGEATKILAETCLARGQRALVGKCSMARNAPDFYRDESNAESNAESLAVTEDVIAHIKRLDSTGEMVRPILTPRFAICCDEELLTGLGAIARRDPDIMIQTHFNETKQEVAFTKQLFPQFTNEADLYIHFGLFNDRTIMGHCIYPSEYEIEKLKERNVGVATCPVSTTTVETWGAAPIRRYLDMGIKVGLGTDSGGGFSSSILDASRQAYITSHARQTLTDGKETSLTMNECFYLATLGGARVCCMADRIGTFEVGKGFDALEITTLVQNTPTALIEDDDSIVTIWEKFMMTGDDRNIAKVYVRGRSIKS